MPIGVFTRLTIKLINLPSISARNCHDWSYNPLYSVKVIVLKPSKTVRVHVGKREITWIGTKLPANFAGLHLRNQWCCKIAYAVIKNPFSVGLVMG